MNSASRFASTENGSRARIVDDEFPHALADVAGREGGIEACEDDSETHTQCDPALPCSQIVAHRELRTSILPTSSGTESTAGPPRRRRVRFFSQPPPPVNEVIRKLGPGLVCRFSVVRGFFSCRSAKDTPLLRSGVESALNKERIRFSNAMRRKSKSGTAFQDLPFCEAVRKAKIISAGFS